MLLGVADPNFTGELAELGGAEQTDCRDEEIVLEWKVKPTVDVGQLAVAGDDPSRRAEDLNAMQGVSRMTIARDSTRFVHRVQELS
jgi:hypothetical protein